MPPQLPPEALTPVLCPHCGQGFGYQSLHAGTQGICPHCSRPVRMPSASGKIILWVLIVGAVLAAIQIAGCIADFQREEQRAALRSLR